MKLVSACLLGIKCRYNGRSKANTDVLKRARKEILIPVCPEQLGGLSTPRRPSEKKGKRIIMAPKRDVTRNFKRGAYETLMIAKILKIKKAILKENSPSCGRNGVTATLLRKNKIKIVSECDIK